MILTYSGSRTKPRNNALLTRHLQTQKGDDIGSYSTRNVETLEILYHFAQKRMEFAGTEHIQTRLVVVIVECVAYPDSRRRVRQKVTQAFFAFLPSYRNGRSIHTPRHWIDAKPIDGGYVRSHGDKLERDGCLDVCHALRIARKMRPVLSVVTKSVLVLIHLKEHERAVVVCEYKVDPTPFSVLGRTRAGKVNLMLPFEVPRWW